MSKYNLLWEYVKNNGSEELKLTFDEIQNIAGISIDHSFLKYKKELAEYGFEVKKISIKNKTVDFSKTKKDTLVLYIHGKGGSANEEEHYKPLFPDCDVMGFDYKANTPWGAKADFTKAFDKLTKGYEHIIIIANSIGAYFAMHALSDCKIDRAYFISPIVDMEQLICDMMTWADISEKELENSQTIKTEFGETLSWEYLCYVRENPVCWKVPTKILYGANDNLTLLSTVAEFADKNGFPLTVMKNGEHWFHTAEQMKFLDDWITESEKTLCQQAKNI